MKNEKENMSENIKLYGFIYIGFSKLIDILQNHTLYVIIRNEVIKTKNRVFPDIAIIFNLVMSFVFANIILKYEITNVFAYIMVIVGSYRMYEMLIYAIHSNFVYEGLKQKSSAGIRIASQRRKLILLFPNVFEMVNYFIVYGVVISKPYWTNAYFEAIKANFNCFVFQNSDVLIGYSEKLKNLAFFQSALGIFYMIVCVAIILSGITPKTIEDDRK